MNVRRIPRHVLAAVCAFLATLAVLLRFQVYESALVLPREQGKTYRLTARSASYFDLGTLTARTGIPLVSTTTLSGDPAAGDEETAVWVEYTSLTTAWGARIDYHERRTAFDRRTGEVVDCCDGYVDEDPRARQDGLAFRLPPRAEPRSYPLYDTVLRRAVPLRYEGAEVVQGVRTHRYAYTAGPIRIEDLGDLPGRALGLPGRRTVAVSRYAEVTRTLWVEPESGLTVKTAERHRQSLRTSDGVERRVSLAADLVMSDEDVAVKAADAKAFTRWVLLVRDVLPGVFGLLALVAALLALPSRRRPEPGGGGRPDAPGESGRGPAGAAEGGTGGVSGGAAPAGGSSSRSPAVPEHG
ncbi:hypothetical protein GCM10010466_47250 [Planomonospora alba]|uniref:DUF3068 domain-containing protein n=1 Tax=Planomonospora alba TaxID=161354 RepID=A0ABP6NJS8_9ACTN